ncbi:ATP-binding protein [Limnobacter sp.]|uniref:ATP-binding protein n=1 Tax=Limnobacter sp. TaxID=2003368 RepID=UPI0035114120
MYKPKRHIGALSIRATTYLLAALLITSLLARLGLYLWHESISQEKLLQQRNITNLLVSNQELTLNMQEIVNSVQGQLLSADPTNAERFRVAVRSFQTLLGNVVRDAKTERLRSIYERVGGLTFPMIESLKALQRPEGHALGLMLPQQMAVEQARGTLDEIRRLLEFVHEMELERTNVLDQDLLVIQQWKTSLEVLLASLTLAVLLIFIAKMKHALFTPLKQMSDQLAKMRDSHPQHLELNLTEPALAHLNTRFNSLIDRVKLREHELRLARAKEVAQLTQAVKEREEFGSLLAHEIRTPLTTLLGTLNIMNSEHRQANAIEMKTMTAVSKSLLSLVNSALDYNSLGNGSVSLVSEPFEVQALCDRLAHLHQTMAANKNVGLRMVCDVNLNTPILGDAAKLEQVLANLLSNAIKFTPPEGQVTLKAQRHTHAQGDTVSFRVEDTGIGIESHALGTIFEPFKQASSGTKRRFGGTGIGLALSKRLVQAMGSDLFVESSPGEGTVFFFSLPHVAGEINPSQPCVTQGPDCLKGIKALMVEDHVMNAKINSRLLSRQGMVVDWVESGELALDQFTEATQYDVVLMDINLGDGLSGVEAAQILLARFKSLCPPILALTAGVVIEQRSHIIASGMKEIIEKPFDLEFASRQILHHVNNHRQHALQQQTQQMA